jgi:hypothetical protein
MDAMTKKTLDQQLKQLQAEMKKATATKEGARALLRKAGILTKHNKVAHPYR